jgi:crossover junction endodeoxyribonuclease RusA
MVAPARLNPSRGSLRNGLDAALDAFFAGGLVLRLPVPQTVNKYWESNRDGSRRISEKGKAFRIDVLACVRNQAFDHRTLTGRIGVRVTMFAPDKRVRDLDNLKKALLDACTHAGVWADDEQIDMDHTVRGPVKPRDGYVKLEVVEL